jgi:hypothetical protein
METLKLLTAATLLAGPAESKGLIFSNCAPRAIALKQHKRMGFERSTSSLQADDSMYEVWRNKYGKRFGTVMDKKSGRTCFVGNLPDEPEV